MKTKELIYKMLSVVPGTHIVVNTIQVIWKKEELSKAQASLNTKEN